MHSYWTWRRKSCSTTVSIRFCASSTSTPTTWFRSTSANSESAATYSRVTSGASMPSLKRGRYLSALKAPSTTSELLRTLISPIKIRIKIRSLSGSLKSFEPQGLISYLTTANGASALSSSTWPTSCSTASKIVIKSHRCRSTAGSVRLKPISRRQPISLWKSTMCEAVGAHINISFSLGRWLRMLRLLMMQKSTQTAAKGRAETILWQR